MTGNVSAMRAFAIAAVGIAVYSSDRRLAEIDPALGIDIRLIR